jgi:hypothetical protein
LARGKGADRICRARSMGQFAHSAGAGIARGRGNGGRGVLATLAPSLKKFGAVICAADQTGLVRAALPVPVAKKTLGVSGTRQTRYALVGQTVSPLPTAVLGVGTAVSNHKRPSAFERVARQWKGAPPCRRGQSRAGRYGRLARHQALLLSVTSAPRSAPPTGSITGFVAG